MGVSIWFASTAIIEEEGILRIKSTSEYGMLVNKYGSDQVSVKAVNLHQTEDARFLKKISDGFKEQLGCIIVLEGGNGEGFVYQLDEEFSIVYRISLSDFENGSGNVDRLTMQGFYSSLK